MSLLQHSDFSIRTIVFAHHASIKISLQEAIYEATKRCAARGQTKIASRAAMPLASMV
jgi:hypothetical protein